MKRIRSIALLLSLATLLTLVGTGFAIWYNVAPLDVSVGGDGENANKLVAYVVDRSDTYVSTDTISIFNYSALSFTDAQGESSDTGTITVNYLLDVEQCRTAYGDSLTLTVTLGYENARAGAALFAAAEGKSITATVGGAAVTPTVNTAGDTLTLTQTLDITGKSGELAVPVVYTFTIPMKVGDVVGNFRNLFGKYLLVAGNTDSIDVTTTFVTQASVAKAS